MAKLITTSQLALLRAMGEGPSAAVSLRDLEHRLPQVKQPSACLHRLWSRGYLAKEYRTDPEAPRANVMATNRTRLWYWLTPAGKALRQESAGLTRNTWVTSPEEAAARQALRHMEDDDERLLAAVNLSRGAVTFRETLRDFGFTTIAEVRAMPLPTWRAFHDRWTAHMKRHCAEAGTPIPERHPNDPWHGNAKHALHQALAKAARDDEDEAAA